MHFQDMYRGVIKVCRKQKVFLLSLSLLTRCQLCDYVCVTPWGCVGKRHSTHPCVLPHQIPSGVSCKRCSHTYKWTDKQQHTIRYIHAHYAVCVHQCVGGRWYPWLTCRPSKPHCFWIPGSTSCELWLYLLGSVCVCHYESEHFTLLSRSTRFVVSVVKYIPTHFYSSHFHVQSQRCVQ